jgi:hypothetical protein
MLLQFSSTATTPICTLFNTSLWVLLAIKSNLGLLKVEETSKGAAFIRPLGAGCITI